MKFIFLLGAGILFGPVLMGDNPPPIPTLATVHIQGARWIDPYVEGHPVVTQVEFNVLAVNDLRDALSCILEKEQQGGRQLLFTFNGSYTYRKIAGKEKWSNHARALAIDLNAYRTQPEEVVMCFENNGFYWGGRWSNPDPMHFDWLGAVTYLKDPWKLDKRKAQNEKTDFPLGIADIKRL